VELPEPVELPELVELPEPVEVPEPVELPEPLSCWPPCPESVLAGGGDEGGGEGFSWARATVRPASAIPPATSTRRSLLRFDFALSDIGISSWMDPSPVGKASGGCQSL
jgi:hypothetical protein